MLKLTLRACLWLLDFHPSRHDRLSVYSVWPEIAEGQMQVYVAKRSEQLLALEMRAKRCTIFPTLLPPSLSYVAGCWLLIRLECDLTLFVTYY